MAWRVEVSAEAERDLGLIFDHLFQSYRGFGDTEDEAFERAARRIRDIQQAAADLARAPHPGTRRDDILPGLRNVTADRAIFWFDLDEPAETVRILAIFFGAQDHVRHMLARLLGGEGVEMDDERK